MVAPRVLVLGGGFGGLAAAHRIRREAGDEVDLVLVDASPTFMMGLRKLWFLDGRTVPGEGTRRRSSLDRAGIPFRQGTASAIDRDRRRVVVDGEAMAYDVLILAPGARPRADLVPGDLTGSVNLYTVEGAEEAGRRLAALDAGRVVILVAGVPYKCPPAPYEAAFLIDDRLRRTGRRGAVELEVLTPQPRSLPVAGPTVSDFVEGTLAARGIRFHADARVEAVEPGRVLLAGGDRVEADLLLVVPPHRPPDVVATAGLSDLDGWITVDPATLATEDERVFAVGDVVAMTTGAGMPFPKAGIFAERHGEVVGTNVAAILSGGEPTARFDGVGSCFMEVGGGEAAKVEGAFLASPPEVTFSEPSPEHLAGKVAFERDRLARWFPEP